MNDGYLKLGRVAGHPKKGGITLELPCGDTVNIFLERVQGRQGFIGINAPRDIVVLRDELLTGDKKDGS